MPSPGEVRRTDTENNPYVIVCATILAVGLLAYLAFFRSAKPAETRAFLSARGADSLSDGFSEQHLTTNRDAYRAYIQGRYYSSKETTPALEQAIQQFQEALRVDPNYALPYAGLAEAYALLGLHYDSNDMNPSDVMPRAKAAAIKAIELNDSLAETHTALAAIKQRYDWDWTGAEIEFKRALELNPNLVEAHRWYSSYLSAMERHSEAIAKIKRAQALDPLSIGLRRGEGWVLYIARRYQEALEKFQQANKIEEGRGPGAHRSLAFIYEGNGMYQQAIDEHQKAIAIEGETTSGQCYLGYALALAGRRREAEEILNRLKKSKHYVSPTELAGLYVMLGDNEGAIAMLERAYTEHDLQLQTLKIDPHLYSLRFDPRFQDLVRRVGLSP